MVRTALLVALSCLFFGAAEGRADPVPTRTAVPDSVGLGYWGALPARTDSTSAHFGTRSAPAWETAVMVPYWIAGLPFRLFFFVGDQAVTGLDKLNMFEFQAEYPGFPGPFGTYTVPSLTMGELQGTTIGLEMVRPRFLRPDGLLNLQANRSTRHADEMSGGAYLPLGGTWEMQLGFGTEEVNLYRYYGTGPDSRPEDLSYYQRETSWLGLGLDRRLGPAFVAGLTACFSRLDSDVAEYNVDRRLDRVHGADLPPGYRAQSNGITLRAHIDWDDTDQTGRPGRGTFRSVALSLFQATDGSGLSYLLPHVAVERFFSLWHTGRTLAVRGFFNKVVPLDGGEIPFTRLISTQRPDFLRGFPPSRFLGRATLGVSAEYRWPVWRPRSRDDYGVDSYLFFDTGQVFDRTADLGWDELRTAGGFGLRLIDENRNLGARVEVAVSNEDVLLRFKLSQTFQYDRKGLMYGKNPTKVY